MTRSNNPQSYKITITETNETFPISSDYIKIVKAKADRIGLEYSVEVQN